MLPRKGQGLIAGRRKPPVSDEAPSFRPFCLMEPRQGRQMQRNADTALMSPAVRMACALANADDRYMAYSP